MRKVQRIDTVAISRKTLLTFTSHKNCGLHTHKKVRKLLKLKGVEQSMISFTATGTRVSYGITQFYLSPAEATFLP